MYTHTHICVCVCVCVCVYTKISVTCGRMDRPAEISDFDLSRRREEKVLGLDVPVYHVLLVAVLQRCVGLGISVAWRVLARFMSAVYQRERERERERERKRERES